VQRYVWAFQLQFHALILLLFFLLSVSLLSTINLLLLNLTHRLKLTVICVKNGKRGKKIHVEKTSRQDSWICVFSQLRYYFAYIFTAMLIKSRDNYSFFKHLFLLIETNLSFICWKIESTSFGKPLRKWPGSIAKLFSIAIVESKSFHYLLNWDLMIFIASLV
jgi:hypothetical protein